MAQRSVVVSLLAQVGNYVSGMGQAATATTQLATAQTRASTTTDQTTAAATTAAAATGRVDAAARAAATALAAEAQAAQTAASALGMSYNSAGKLVDANGRLVSSEQAAAAGLAQHSAAVEQNARALDGAAAASNRAQGSFRSLANNARENEEAWTKAGTAITAAGVAITGVLGATAKASMDWESAWAGVTKTVDGTPAQMAEMEAGLRNLAKTLPLTHEEIAGVAEAAGQLGVKREDVLGFTKTMIDLGVSTNLTSEEAATSIAQISNVMGTMSREGAEGVARFGATLVDLGNNGASTEKDILSMAQRISGAGATVGASEVEVLALSNALASMGIQAELGGGVTTRVLLKMFTAVKDGGEKLENFAAVAGMSAGEFSKAFSESPVHALDMVAQGLNRMNQEGGNVVATMKDLGIKGTQETQVMLALTNSGTLLNDSLELGAKAWENNTALLDEATKRYATTDSQVKIAWNNIKDSAISAGAVLLPVIASMAKSVGTLADWFGNLPAPVLGAMTGLSALVGVAAVLAGGFLVLFPRVIALRAAFVTLNTGTGPLAGNLGKLGKALGIAGLLAAVAGAAIAMNNSMQPAVATTEEMTQALIGLKSGADSIDNIFANIDPGDGGLILQNVNNIGDALLALDAPGVNNAMGRFGANVLHVNNDFAKMSEAVANVDTALAGAVGSGNLELASKGFRAVAKSAAEQGIGLDELKDKFPTYINSLREAASTAGVHVEEQDLLNWAMGETPQVMLDAAAATDSATESAAAAAAGAAEAAEASQAFIDAMEELGLSTDGTITSLDKFTAALFASGLATMSSRDAAFGWQDTLRGLDKQIADVNATSAELGGALNLTGTDFDKLTQAGKNANEVFQGVLQAGLGVATTFAGDVSKSAADVNQQLHDTYDAGVVAAKGLGLGEEAAIALTREVLGIPTGVSIETWMDDQALAMSGNTTKAIEDIPTSVHVNTSMDKAAFETAGMTKKAAEDIPNQETIDSWMSDAAFIEAIRTRAAAEGIPPEVAVDSFMQSAARNEADETAAQILKIPKGASITSFMEEYARLEAERTAAAINGIPSYKRVDVDYVNTTTNIVRSVHDEGHIAEGPGGRGGITKGGATGGRVSDLAEGYASGGRVPGSRSANIAKDNVLGMVNGRPFGLQGTEWIINPRSSDAYDAELAAINEGSFPKGALSGAPSSGREWAAPAATVSAPNGGTPVTAALSAEDRALLREVVNRPIQGTFKVGARAFAEVVAESGQYRARR